MKAVSLGVPLQRALKDMAERVGSDDLSLIVTAINVQYEMGGNLGLVLESISQTVRERIRIKREIQVLTAQQRLTGYILAGFPVFLAVTMTIIKPTYFAPFLEPGPIRLLPAGSPGDAGHRLLFHSPHRRYRRLEVGLPIMQEAAGSSSFLWSPLTFALLVGVAIVLIWQALAPARRRQVDTRLQRLCSAGRGPSRRA